MLKKRKKQTKDLDVSKIGYMFAEQIIKKIIFMKKKILGGLFAFAVMVATSYGVNRSMENDADLSDMALSNVEALALGEQGENDPFPPINPMCPNRCLDQTTVGFFGEGGGIILFITKVIQIKMT